MDLNVEDTIISAACTYFKVDKEYFIKKDSKQQRLQQLTIHRSILFFLLYKGSGMSYHDLKLKFNYRSHQPILRLVKIVEMKIKKKDPLILKHIASLNKLINP